MSILKSRKFRVDILTIFITLFFISILGLTYYFYTQSSAAVLKVANGFISRTIDSISEKMNKFLQPTPLFSISNLIMSDSTLDAADMASLTSYMHIILQSYPQLINAYIADTNGNLFIESRIINKVLYKQFIPFAEDVNIPIDARFVSSLLTPFNNTANAIMILKNQNGIAIKQNNLRFIQFDPRKRPWYVGAKDNKKSMWIGMYPFFKTDVEVISIAFPIYVNDIFMGVAAADIGLDSIREAINQFSVDVNGVVFIASESGQLIAAQKDDETVNPEVKVSTVFTTKNELIKKSYELYHQHGEDHFTFRLDGVEYIAQFKKYSISGDEKWEMCVVIPIDFFVGEINKVNRNAIFFSLLTLLFGLIMVVISSNKISRPIIQLAAETKKMKHLNFTKSEPIITHIYEVQVMVGAVNSAKAALSSFSKYVPKMLVEQLMKNGIVAEVGGEKKKISIMFSDIKNFTALTESTDPNELMICLSDYLNELTKCIQHYHGNIDKYMGDSVMAFWGAPQDDGKQVRHACLAALSCRHHAHKLAQQAAEQGKPVFMTRFGLNTGTAIIGNVGSSDRLNYTAIGSTVNVASRLEEINKHYDTEIIVSESVFVVSKDDFLFRPVDIIFLKGKSEPVQIYELVAENREGTHFPATEQQVELCVHFAEACQLFHNQQYQAALDMLLVLISSFPDDKLTQLYIERCTTKLLS